MADNIGSFGAAIGGGSALAQAMQSRGIDISALQQQSPAAAGGGTPMPQEPSQLQAAQLAVGGGGAPVQTANQPIAEPQQQPTNPELAIALEALGGFVKTEGQTRRDVVKGRMQGVI